MDTTLIKSATKNLEDDHIYILQLTQIMDKISGMSSPDIFHMESIVDIIRNFADGIHHAKEEHAFFPLLSQRGFSMQNGPVAVMLNEHIAGRNFVKGMAESIDSYKAGNGESLARIFLNMKGYAELLRSHIAKENNVLFKMADRVLSDTDQKDLAGRFTSQDNNRQVYIDRIASLANFYL